MRQTLLGIILVLVSIPAWAQQTAAKPAPIGAPRLVALNVPSLEAAVAWYHDNLGFEKREQRDFPDYGVRIAMLEHQGFWLEIVEKKRTVSPASVRSKLPEIADWDDVQGIKKLAFLVSDLDAVRAQLKKNGVKFRTEIMGSASDRAFGQSFIVQDESGNWIQFCEVK